MHHCENANQFAIYMYIKSSLNLQNIICQLHLNQAGKNVPSICQESVHMQDQSIISTYILVPMVKTNMIP